MSNQTQEKRLRLIQPDLFITLSLIGIISWLLFTAHSHAQDITEIRTSASLSTWRLDQIDQNRADIKEIRTNVRENKAAIQALTEKLNSLSDKVSSLDDKVNRLEAGQNNIINILQILVKKEEEREDG